MKEKISVIVPIYKVEKYLEKCVDSILNQTYSNTEVILVEDGSPDKCGEMCDMYAEKDSRVVVLHKENGGLSDARNAGMLIATGEYISFVDSDDYIEPDMLEIMYNRMKEDGTDLVVCNFSYVDEEGNIIKEKNQNSPIKDEMLTGEQAFSRLAGKKYWYYVTAWNKLYRRDLLKDIEFPKGKINEDEFVAHYVLAKCNRISCVEKSLYMYVQREHSIMHRLVNGKYTIKNFDAMEAFCSRVMFAKKRNKAVMRLALQKAGQILLQAYRDLGKENQYKSILNEKRKVFNKAYREALAGGLHPKTAIKYGIVFLHPNLYISLAKLLGLEKKEEKC